MKIFYKLTSLFIIILTISSCQMYKESPTDAIHEIITAFNNADYETLWNRTVNSDQDAIADELKERKKNHDMQFYRIISYTLNSKDIDINSITNQQYLYILLKQIAHDNNIFLENIKKISSKVYAAKINTGDDSYNLPLIYIKGKWYMQLY